MTRDNALRLFIDVGTNCEIALGLAGAASLHGGARRPGVRRRPQIRCGMRAARGRDRRSSGSATTTIELDVIGEVEPIGLCGSGLVDVVAELAQAGLLDRRAGSSDRGGSPRRPPACATGSQVRGTVSVCRAPLARRRRRHRAGAIYLSQRDVRELQFAKASIATGWRLLVEELGVDAADIQQVLLAGSFGSYLAPASAVRIGLVPGHARPAHHLAGNVAGEGAKMALLSIQERARGYARCSSRCSTSSSPTGPDFNDRFVDELAFPGGAS